jgi:hypothetical protein
MSIFLIKIDSAVATPVYVIWENSFIPTKQLITEERGLGGFALLFVGEIAETAGGEDA